MSFSSPSTSKSPSPSPSPSTMVNGGSNASDSGSGSVSSVGLVAPSSSKPKSKAPKPAALKKTGYKALESKVKSTNMGWFLLQFAIPLAFMMFTLHITGVQEFRDNYWVKWWKGELDEDGNPLPNVPVENGFHMLYPENAVPSDVSKKKDQATTTSSARSNLSPYCERRFRSMMGLLGRVETFKQANIEIHLHRNGDPNACGKTTGGMFLDELINQYANFDDGCRSNLNKYEVESLLTSTLHLLTESSCASDDDEQDDKTMKGFLGFCDRGPSKTPILPDHDDLVPVSVEYNRDEKNVEEDGGGGGRRRRDRPRTLPCRFHTREGLRISIFKQITDMALFENEDTDDDDDDDEDDDSEILDPVDSQATTEETSTKTDVGRDIHLYAVPAGRLFMFAPSYVGEIFNLTHVNGVHNDSIYLEVMSLDPRVFDIHNFFSRQESQDLVDKAIAEKSPSHKIKRSTTGAGMFHFTFCRSTRCSYLIFLVFIPSSITYQPLSI